MVPLPIFECLDTWAFGEIIRGNENPALIAKSKS